MQQQLSSPTASRVAELERAFADFTHTSLQLETAYRELEQRAAVLSAALAQAQDERLAYLTEKERLADRLTGLLETLPAGVVVLDSDGNISDCNPAATALLGKHLAQQPWRHVVERCFAGEGTGGGEFTLRDGRSVSIATRRLEEGRILVLTDVTETRRLQALLARNRRLSEMGQMNARLAHQLRTPLATAVLYASQLRNKSSTEREQRYAEKISASLQRLERMVNDMLRFAGGSGAPHHQQLAVNELFAEVAAQLEAQLSDDIVLEFGAPPGLMLSGDRDALVGALANLASNAIEHGGASVHITLDAQRSDDDVVLSVADNGPGVAPEHRTQIFEPFYTTRSSGTGLGLAVVASVARAHRGRAGFEPVPGGGAQFTIRIPASNPSALQSGAAAHAYSTGQCA